MLDIRVEVNGRPVDPEDVASDFARRVIAEAAKKFEQILREKVSAEDVAKLTVTVKGVSWETLESGEITFTISGDDDDAVARSKAAFGVT